MSRGRRLVRGLRDFFSEMESGRILLLAMIACVMLWENIYATLVWFHYSFTLFTVVVGVGNDYGFRLFMDVLPELLAYSIALCLGLCTILAVRRRMRARGEAMTLEHLRELTFIALALALLLAPSTSISMMGSIDHAMDPDPRVHDIERTRYLLNTIGLVVALALYAAIALLSWRACRRRTTAQTHHRLARGRVLVLTLIAAVMLSSDVVRSYGWVRYHQIYGWGEVSWYSFYASPLWFYYGVVLVCSALVWSLHTWRRMRSENVFVSPGQLQELAVIAIGLWLLFLPFFINGSVDFIERFVLDEPDYPSTTSWEAYEAMEFFQHLGLLYEFLAYLLVGLIAFRFYQLARPIDVTTMAGPPGPPGREASLGSAPGED